MQILFCKIDMHVAGGKIVGIHKGITVLGQLRIENAHMIVSHILIDTGTGVDIEILCRKARVLADLSNLHKVFIYVNKCKAYHIIFCEC